MHVSYSRDMLRPKGSCDIIESFMWKAFKWTWAKDEDEHDNDRERIELKDQMQ